MSVLSSIEKLQALDFAVDSVLFQRQLDLEREMEENGERTIAKLHLRAREKEQEANTLYGSVLLRSGVSSLAEAIEAFQAECETGKAGRKHIAGKLLSVFPDVRVVAFLALRQALNGVTQKQSLSRISLSVADVLQREAKLIEFKSKNAELYKRMTSIIKSKDEHHRYAAMSVAMGRNEIGFDKWTLNERTQLGMKLIDLMISSTGYFEITSISKDNKQSNYLVATPRCMSKIKDYQTNELMTPEYLPTIIPPKPWTNVFDGGYYSKIKPLWLVKARFNPKNYLEELNNRADEMPTVYAAINAIQNTAYHINRRVYDVMTTLWERGGGRAKLADRDDYGLPPCPICGERFFDVSKTRKHKCFGDKANKEQFIEWKRAAEDVYYRNSQLFSKKLQLCKILNLADKFKDEAAIYFPHQLDFRGRAYPVPAYLQPQGTDWAKGLLEFAESKPLEDIDAVKWLAVHGANVYGQDKLSLVDRFVWVIDNEDAIIKAANEPLNDTWWQMADKPFQFLAFCFDWAGYVEACERGTVYHSNLPVAMDGTCNGLQIFSLLLRDEVGGRATNLLPSYKPQDIYKIVAEKVILKLTDRAEHGNKRYKKDSGELLYDEKVLAPLLLDLGITRKTTKRQVMTLPYGATYTSCKDYTNDWLKEQKDGSTHEIFRVYPNTFHISMFLSELIWEAIHETVIAARGAMDFLQKLAGKAAKEGLPVTWTTPVGMTILQAYKETKSKKIKCLLGSSVIQFRVNEETPKLDTAEQKSGISPNFIHSLDAAAMMKTIETAADKGVTSFAMVHDSYGTHAADAKTLALSLRETFVGMFTSDHLSRFRDEVMEKLPEDARDDLPCIPESGTLEISKLLESEYFFA